jgi:hypothetical protein
VIYAGSEVRLGAGRPERCAVDAFAGSPVPPGHCGWLTVRGMNRAGRLDVARSPRPGAVGVVLPHRAGAGMNT